MSSKPQRTGLALSGGGYRATAFHLGTLRKLHELGMLNKIDVMSTISGGSITGAYYCSQEWKDFDTFYDDLYKALLTKSVVKRTILSWLGLRILVLLLLLGCCIILLFTCYAWLFLVILIPTIFLLARYQFILLPISRRIEQVYDKFFYHQKQLSELNERPKLIIGSTNLQTARPFSFSRTKMWDTSYGSVKEPTFTNVDFPIARAVMASSCVPFAFTPVRIAKKFILVPKDIEGRTPLLVDGGVYDNQGIHKIVQENSDLHFIITSDAGGGSTKELKLKNTFTLLSETVNVFMARIKKAQMVSDVYGNADTLKKEIAYFSLAWDVEKCIPGFVDNLKEKNIIDEVIQAHHLKAEWVNNPEAYRMEIENQLKANVDYNNIPKPTDEEKKIARTVSTNLKALKPIQLDSLIKQAMALTEIQVKLYCPSLLTNKNTSGVD